MNALPLASTLRVWDMMLFERSSAVLFRVATALMDMGAQKLLQERDPVELWTTISRMPSQCFDSSQLLDRAMLQFSHIDEYERRPVTYPPV